MNTNELLFWAKSDRDDPSKYHPVLYHMLDVANVTQYLWDDCLSDSIRDTISNDFGLAGKELRLFVSFLSGLHDIGKITPAFQVKNEILSNCLKQNGYEISNESRNYPGFQHGFASTRIIRDLLHNQYKTVKIKARILAQLSGGHHGIFPVNADFEKYASLAIGDTKWEETRGYIINLFLQLLSENMETSFNLQNLVLENPATIPIIAGLISVSDWIGSNADYFVFDNETEPKQYKKFSQERAMKALNQLGWLPPVKPAEPLPFNRIFPFQPNSIQSAVIDEIQKRTPPFLLVVEAQMGQGKTEAALYSADWLLSNHHNRGFYVALPTQATSNAMYNRIRNDYLDKRGHKGNLNLQLVHGNSLMNDFFNVHENSSEENDYNIEAQSWFTVKKRTLLSPFGVGTIDQSLLSVLQTRHWFIRLFGLANKTVIFDEVHAYDTYMSTILEQLVEWLSIVKSSVILLSATLPNNKLKSLIKAYNPGMAILENTAYPRITFMDKTEITTLNIPDDKPSKTVQLDYLNESIDALHDYALEKTKISGCGVIICNTVSRSQEVYESIKSIPDCDCYLFHARTLMGWRKEMEEKVLGLFGKESSKRPVKAILVATQVVEQSLDLDFDWMVSDMAPIDLLLQRMGRLWRHERIRNFSFPNFCIIANVTDNNTPPEFKSSQYVYDKYILLRSWLILHNRQSLVLPNDIDSMVQAVYSEQSLDIELNTEWKKAIDDSENKMNEDNDDSRQKASVLLIHNRTPLEDALDKFNRQLEDDDNPELSEQIRAATREGEPSVNIVCVKETEEGLAFFTDNQLVDIEKEPGWDKVKILLENSVGLNHKGIYHLLKNKDAPLSWKNCSSLRYHRLLRFRNNQIIIGNYMLEISPEKGIQINKGDK